MNKQNNILVFIPDVLEFAKTGFLRGFYERFDDSEAYFITSTEPENDCFPSCIGYVGHFSKNSTYMKEKTLYFDVTSHELTINRRLPNQSVVQITYDFKTFKNSDVVNSNFEHYGKHIRTLTDKLKEVEHNSVHIHEKTDNLVGYYIIQTVHLILKLLLLCKPMTTHLETFSQLNESLNTLKWFLTSFIKDKKISVKLGNVLCAKLFDLFLGIVCVKILLKYEDDINGFIEGTFEEIISNLKRLLIYLMGSPIGLKLNYAFNHSLGAFFFYHINLWRVFLMTMEPLLGVYFKHIIMFGALGFSFQMAMLSDIISIATFHVYCIYVYAARLFAVQIKGLTSLWRLFIGRKYNPLRNRVDSCDYSPDQLFIGTLGFTVLLFLLPTTTMYYTVFATFRLVILCATSLLTKTRFFLNRLPIYVVVLWLFNSPSMAGTFYITWKNGNQTSNVVNIEAKMKTLPLRESINKFMPDNVTVTEKTSLTSTFHNVLLDN